MKKMKVVSAILASMFVIGAVVSGMFGFREIMVGNMLMSMTWALFYKLYSTADKI